MNTHSDAQKIKGFIQVLPKPAADEEDMVKVAIVTTEGTEYPVLHKGAGVDLVDHVSADVEVVAWVEDAPQLEGGKALRVRRYTVTDGYEDPWYDDDDNE